MIPPTANSDVKPVGSWEYVQACQVGGSVHVIATSYGNTSRFDNFYRLGFDFVPDSSDVASALAPENSEQDTTGWHMLEQGMFLDYAKPFIIDADFILIDSWKRGRLWKPNPLKVGKFVRAELIESGRPHYLRSERSDNERVAAFPAGDDVYLVFNSQFQDLRFFHRVGGTFVPVPHSIPGNAASMVRFLATLKRLYSSNNWGLILNAL